ncbi:hypothetical protein [Hoeflea sp. AS16]|uniref:hypothetical protein n=1 Tax=Hoeflea sp. AS16 TaxID=3135779 RepID=UPI00316B560A
MVNLFLALFLASWVKLMKFLCFILVFALIPANAFASCSDYFNSKRENHKAQAKLLWEYKGTAATVLGCAGVCMNEPPDKVGGCVIASCGLACLFIGLDNCFDFFTQQYGLVQSEKRIETYGRQHQCSR